MKNYFRVQKKGYTFEQMKSHNSGDGGDGHETGLAVSAFANGLDGGSRFGGAWEAMDDDDDVIVLTGYVIFQIYDGYRIDPLEEIARFTVSEWKKMMADGRAEEQYEYQ
jgi:hypothetical protein